MTGQLNLFPMKEANLILRKKWSPQSIRDAFRSGNLRSFLLIQNSNPVPIPHAYWINWQVGKACPDNLSLRELKSFVDAEIAIIDGVANARHSLDWLEGLTIFRPQVETLISNHSEMPEVFQIQKCQIQILRFLRSHERIKYVLSTDRESTLSFVGDAIKNTRKGRLPKESGDTFYNELCAEVIFKSGGDITSLKNADLRKFMRELCDRRNYDKNIYSNSHIKRRVDALLDAVRDNLEARLESDH
jgi:hypothetical protein